ncbi:sensor histidine kinase [Azospirillum halopraeferens]|uniref:sensor histidine kinase n=1 Tax=Azospirillum halopraeferens TaxID=34010 RepID=UPI001B3BE0FC|nr:histidine kinase dimerization/phosphoacceptor domain -containing protein [Azospirillum halopraeferens]
MPGRHGVPPERTVLRRVALSLTGAVVLVTTLLGIGAYWTYHLAHAEARATTHGMTRLVASQVERLLDAADLMLGQMAETAAATDWARPGAGVAARDRLRRLQASLPISFRLFVWGPEGKLLATTLDGAGATPDATGRDYFEALRPTDRGLYVSDPLYARIDGRPILVFSRRVSGVDGRFLGAVSFSVESAEIARLYSATGLPERWVFAWVDRVRRTLLLREPASPSSIAANAALPPEVMDAITAPRAEGWVSYRSVVDGEGRTAFYVALDQHPIAAFVAMSDAAVREQWLKSSLPYFAMGLLAAAALAVAGRFALRWAQGEDGRRQALAGANADLERMVAARTAELVTLLDERDGLIRAKDTLIQEVNHRVKNSLQQVASMLTLQAATLPTGQTRRALEDACSRVNAIGLVHGRLYESDFTGRVEAMGYLRDLCANIARTASPACRITLEGSPVELPLARAVPLALLLNELLTNAIKHACTPDAAATIRVFLEDADDGTLRLTVADEGPGIDPAVDPLTTNSLGMRLIRTFVRQLGGAFTVSAAARGTHIVVTFPREAP